MSKTEISGFTLVELMIAVAIVGILSVVAIPLYSSYIKDSRAAVLQENVQGIRLRQEDFALDRRRYVSGTFNPADPDNTDGLKTRLGWDPGASATNVTYVVVCGSVDSSYFCTRSGGYYVTATDSNYPDEAICMSFGATCP